MRAWVGLGLLLWAMPAGAELALSSNDAHTVLVDGAQLSPANAASDTLTVIDMSVYPPTVVTTVDVPGSVVGPPLAVAIAKDESFAVVTSATKADPAGPAGISPDDRVSVVDLEAKPPAIVQSLTAGSGAGTVRMSPDGSLALVANRFAGTVSVFTVKERRLTPSGTVQFDAKSLPSGIAFTPDGKSALVSLNGGNSVQVLSIEGEAVAVDPRPITTGVGPYTMDISPDGQLAAVGNMGRGDGDIDTVSLIDLSVAPFRTIQTLSVGRSPEGLKWSPDGKFLAIGAQNGTNKPPSSPFVQDRGRLIMLALEAKSLRPVAEVPIGRWSQGIVFSKDGRTVLVQNMVERNIMVFRWDGTKLFASNPLEIGAGPAAITTSWP